MRKFVYLTILIVAVSGALTGCGGNGKSDNSTNVTAESDNNANVDVQEAADEILAGGDFKDNLAVVDKAIALTRLYELDEANIEACAFYTNSNATAEEIAVIKTNNNDYIDTVKSAFETRLENQKEACENYLPDEIPKLESAVIYTKGNYVILCVSNDNSKAKSIIEDLFK